MNPRIEAWAARVRAERARRGITQAQLAELLHVHVLTVSRWERARMDAGFWRRTDLEKLEGEAVARA